MAIFQVRRFVFFGLCLCVLCTRRVVLIDRKSCLEACLQAGFSGNLYKEQRLLKHSKGFVGFCCIFNGTLLSIFNKTYTFALLLRNFSASVQQPLPRALYAAHPPAHDPRAADRSSRRTISAPPPHMAHSNNDASASTAQGVY